MEKIEQPLCMCCDHPLEELEPMDCDDVQVRRFQCPHCGLIEESATPEPEDQQFYPAYNGEPDNGPDVEHGYHGLCPECGHHIIWGADFMRSEVVGDIPLTKENQKKYDELSAEIEKAEAELKTDEAHSDLCWRDALNSKLERMKRERIDLEYEGIDDDEDSLAPSVSCPHCGASIQLIYPMTSEQKKYDYYKE